MSNPIPSSSQINQEALYSHAAEWLETGKPYDDVVIDTGPRPQPLSGSGAALSQERLRIINPILLKIQKKLNHLRSLASDVLEPSPSGPLQEEKNHRRDKCLIPLACIPGVGTGITAFKERDFKEKLKHTFDEGERAILLVKQKDFRISALVRTMLTVALAITFLAIAIFTGGVSAALGLGMMAGALILGSGFTGLYAGLLHDSNKKMKPPVGAAPIEGLAPERVEQEREERERALSTGNL
jgi:hypothetical protein